MKRAKPKKTKTDIPRTFVPPRALEPVQPEREAEEEEEQVEEEVVPKPRGRKAAAEAPRRATTSSRATIRDALLRVAREAYEGYELPEFVEELADQLTLDDADVFWEFASLIHSPGLLTDFYVAIKEELTSRAVDSSLSSGKIPHYLSLSFVSPALFEQRKVEEERDGQLLRKDKPVRGAIFCGRCGDNLISTRQIQLRGLDEPSTNIYTCYSCPNMWSV